MTRIYITDFGDDRNDGLTKIERRRKNKSTY
jgi:hypothetical protein